MELKTWALHDLWLLILPSSVPPPKAHLHFWKMLYKSPTIHKLSVVTFWGKLTWCSWFHTFKSLSFLQTNLKFYIFWKRNGEPWQTHREYEEKLNVWEAGAGKCGTSGKIYEGQQHLDPIKFWIYQQSGVCFIQKQHPADELWRTEPPSSQALPDSIHEYCLLVSYYLLFGREKCSLAHYPLRIDDPCLKCHSSLWHKQEITEKTISHCWFLSRAIYFDSSAYLL